MNRQVLDKNKRGQKTSSSSSSLSTSDHAGTKSKVLKPQTRVTDTVRNECTPSNPTVSSNSQGVKKYVKTNESLSAIDHQTAVGKNASNVRANNQSSCNSNHGNVRSMNNSVENSSKDYLVTRSKDHSAKKFTGDYESKTKNYFTHSDYGKGANLTNHQEYKPRNNNNSANLSQSRFASHSTSVQVLQQQRDSNNLNKSSRNDVATTVGLTTAHKALEQHNLVPKMGQINFPPLRAPQSIVNVRHPFVTEARIKQNDMGVGSLNQKSTSVTSSLQNSLVKDLEHTRQTFHGYSSSPIANIPNVQTLGNLTSLAQYPRPDTFTQPTLASVLFPESSQFPQSPPYATGQINQFQAYDHGSFTPTPVNVSSVIPQFSADNSQLSYPQFENPQFVQPNHYPTADMANGQYQYQTAGVGQIPDSPLYLQSLQSPLTVADQYVPPNYAQAVRTELIPRLRRPPRFNK